MPTYRPRLKRIERELKFQTWSQGKRLIEGFSVEQLLAYAERCEIPDPLPRKVPSKFDGMGREALMRLWEEDERRIMSHARKEEQTT